MISAADVFATLREVAQSAGYRIEFGSDELSGLEHAGVCVYSKRLIQLAPGLEGVPKMATFVLLHELAHALLHDSYLADDGITGATHEIEANTVRKLVWPRLDGYPFDYGPVQEMPSELVLDVVSRIVSHFGNGALGE